MSHPPHYRKRRIASALTLLACLLACNRAPAPTPLPGPDSLALELFELDPAQPDEPTVERLFGPVEDDRKRAALYDSIGALEGLTEARVVASQALAPVERIAVDLTAGTTGGGEAWFSVQLEPIGESWRIRWFQGPGVEWPTFRTPRGEGLSISASPETP